MVKSTIFSELTNKEIEELLKITVEIKISANSVVLEQDKPSQSIYILKNGTVNLQKISDTNEKIDLGTTEKQTFFGELSILDGKGNPYTLKTNSECTFLRIDKNKLDILYKINKKLLCKFYLSIIRYINYNLRKANEKLAQSKSNVIKL